MIGAQVVGALVSFPVGFYFGVKAGLSGVPVPPDQMQVSILAGAIATWGVYLLLAPSLLSVSARRLHDSGRSARLLWLIPAFILVICTVAALLAAHRGADAKAIGFAFGWWLPTAIILSPISLFWWQSRPSSLGQNPHDPNTIEVFR
jgi:uncharacterized membrane protein YhaH (DUF805 family)